MSARRVLLEKREYRIHSISTFCTQFSFVVVSIHISVGLSTVISLLLTGDHPCSLVVRTFTQSAPCGQLGFNPRPRHTKDLKTWRFVLLRLLFGIDELGNTLAGLELYNGLSDSLVLICGGFDLVAWHPKTLRHRLFSPNKTGPNYLTTPTPTYTCMHH